MPHYRVLVSEEINRSAEYVIEADSMDSAVNQAKQAYAETSAFALPHTRRVGFNEAVAMRTEQLCITEADYRAAEAV